MFAKTFARNSSFFVSQESPGVAMFLIPVGFVSVKAGGFKSFLGRKPKVSGFCVHLGVWMRLLT